MRQIHSETGVCFFRIPSSVSLKEFLCSADFSPLAIGLSEAVVDSWLEGGCVYVNGLRQRENVVLEAEQIIRLHTRPKRYLEVANLSSHIVLDHAEFLVLDKPSGLPTHPTLDNYIENAKVLLERELKQTLYTTHRLDVPTQGLLILAKSPRAQRSLNKAFSLGRVEKIYRCLCEGRVAPGLYTHFIDPESKVPRTIDVQDHPGWWTCRLEVLGAAMARDNYALVVRLLTGKTHQIRAQMAALGAPVVGDITYGAKESLVTPQVQIALECFQLGFSLFGEPFTVQRPSSIHG
jgi:23S rRNA pseudouridine1911/1915/1917 synthase